MCHECQLIFFGLEKLLKRCGGRPFDHPDRRGPEGKMRRAEATVSRPPGARPVFIAAQGDAAGPAEPADRGSGGPVEQQQHPTDAEIPR